MSPRKLLSILSPLIFFAAGVFFGTYYQTELTVLWRGLFPSGQTSEPKRELREIDFSEESVIHLPNLEEPLPLVYSTTLEEEQIQKDLQAGASVLPLGRDFGDPGNVVVTAHSSGLESFGPYRFAFAKLSELEEGEQYSVQTPAATYTYQVYGKEVVWPHEVDKLPQDDRSTVTLVTCWPLWTNFKRLLVHSELVSVEYNT